jgi:hypothetical protein
MAPRADFHGNWLRDQEGFGDELEQFKMLAATEED